MTDPNTTELRPVNARSSCFAMNIILGVGGGIAAYKAAELARLLMQQGHQVQVVMTPRRRSSSGR